MKQKKSKEEIILEYEKKADETVQQMLAILLKAQRKVDDKVYKQALKSIKK